MTLIAVQGPGPKLDPVDVIASKRGCGSADKERVKGSPRHRQIKRWYLRIDDDNVGKSQKGSTVASLKDDPFSFNQHAFDSRDGANAALQGESSQAKTNRVAIEIGHFLEQII